ncbi:T9SS type A sorting domain-containing protein [Carboxylicivirga caseinilyticus]|uniref:T9SS type A sorting domain-containing protein n=1 Tax=Carboxylicivirga caseinilyticus TaxID=3417572 RepID=UPI003D344130|nr:T9SS type A sorting domain-containing protein [Marinilabiliaceae bacterium A049]
MKKKILLSILFSLTSTIAMLAQIVAFQGISKTRINLSSSTVVGEVTINPQVAGKVIVRFDGDCSTDVGDRIVLAASNTPNWGTNDGSVSVEAVSNDIPNRPFSHTRVYDVSPGSNTFYAIAQNYVETDGSGIASIYGSLTVEFVPNGVYTVTSDNISQVQIDLTTKTVVGQVAVDANTSGKVIVHFDGRCISDVGDRIVLCASNTTSWTSNDGNVAVEAIDTDLNRNSFSHTRVYDVTAGSHAFYAVAQNYVETDGSGVASVYGTLTAVFIPDGLLPFAYSRIVEVNTDLTNVKTVGQVSINAATSGKAIVHFDGMCNSDEGDMIVLAASDTPDWAVNDGNISVQAVDADLNHNSFSHTRVYDINAGYHTFYAVAHNYVETAGSGVASIYGSLTVEFIPDATSTIIDNQLVESAFNIYPNPCSGSFCIEGASTFNCEIYNMAGNKVVTFLNNRAYSPFNIENLPSGSYLVKIITDEGSLIKKLIVE